MASSTAVRQSETGSPPWTRKETRKLMRGLLLALAAALVLGIGVTVLVMHYFFSTATVQAPAGTAGSSAVSGEAVSAAVTKASSVAAYLHAKGFTDCGATSVLGLADSGAAELNGKRIGIGVTETHAALENWLSLGASVAAPLPFEEGSTWAAYVAENQTGAACS